MGYILYVYFKLLRVVIEKSRGSFEVGMDLKKKKKCVVVD